MSNSLFSRGKFCGQQKLSRWIKGTLAPDPIVPGLPDPDLAATSNWSSTVNANYILAQYLFKVLVQHLSTQNENQNTERQWKLSLSRILDDTGRFKACAGCLGINKPESNSMLSLLPEVAMQCSKLLEKLTADLQKGYFSNSPLKNLA